MWTPTPGAARDFQVVSIPTMILFKDGQPVKRSVGAKGKAALLRELSDRFPTSPDTLWIAARRPRLAWRFPEIRIDLKTITASCCALLCPDKPLSAR